MPYKDEQIVIIAPGSLETLAQLGIPETMSPAALRVRSRMFPAQQEGEWEPYKVRQRKKSQAPSLPESGENRGAPAQDEEPEYFEDFTTDGEGRRLADGAGQDRRLELLLCAPDVRAQEDEPAPSQPNITRRPALLDDVGLREAHPILLRGSSSRRVLPLSTLRSLPSGPTVSSTRAWLTSDLKRPM